MQNLSLEFKFYGFQISNITDLINKKQVKQENPEITSFIHRLMFNNEKGIQMSLNHGTIFRFGYQVMAYYVITLQFSDVLN